jgi:peptidoglycan biosynthesis protein MviN/MurJ (putative lipid II flippase)
MHFLPRPKLPRRVADDVRGDEETLTPRQDLRELKKRMVRPLGAAGLNPIARVAEQVIVSFLPTGSITVMNYGYRLISAIGGTVFFRSVIVAVVPRLSEAVERKDEDKVAEVTRLGVRLMFAVSLPLTALMAVLAEPAVLVVFRRGNFDREAASLLGLTLAVYASSLVGSAVQRALLTPFYAALDTRIPFRNTVYGVLANLGLLLVLTLPFRDHPRTAVVGVAVAYSIAQYVNVIHAYWRLRHPDRDKRFRPPVPLPRQPFEGIVASMWKLTVATGVAAGVMYAVGWAIGLGDRAGRLEQIGRIAVVGVVGVVIVLWFTVQALRERPARPAPAGDAVPDEMTVPPATAPETA